MRSGTVWVREVRAVSPSDLVLTARCTGGVGRKQRTLVCAACIRAGLHPLTLPQAPTSKVSGDL
ncbi:hypothetical protein RR48_09916 [Papilio machaon]|uniref:Uncharacterized protein n=1 Tax=Papilio machaon TaxID=76193 RepID=A0A194REZ7_PAPMA|nr:hypothetical protein RR48_09916 [Papilio machaon]